MTRAEDVELTLAQELAEVSRLVEADDIAATLDRFIGRVVRTVPGCDHATIAVMGANGIETVAGDDELELTAAADAAMTSAGPIAEALQYGEPRRLDDAAGDRRWPEFSTRIEAAGYRSCLVLPLATRHGQPTVFALYSRQSDQFESHTYDVVLLLTLHAEAVFDNAKLYHDSRRLVAHLSTALGTRLRIGQAQGLLMHRFGYDADAAFDVLRRASQHTNTKLRDVAAALVEAHEQDDLASALVKYEIEDPSRRPPQA